MNKREIVEAPEVEEETKKFNWKPLVIYAGVVMALGIGIGFLVSAIVKDFVYLEIICAIFGVLSMLIAMFRIRARDSKNYKTNKTIYEDKHSMAYKNWLGMQLCMVGVGIILLLLTLVFFLIFRAQ